LPEFSDYIVFVDESGDHGLASIDPSYPMFVLAFCVFHVEEYAATVVPAVLRLKFRHFGHDQVILHEHDIRKTKGPFRFLLDAGRRQVFYDDLNALVEQSPFTLVAGAIHKERHLARYADAANNPYHVAMGFGLERVFLHLNAMGCRRGTTHVVFERRGAKEDQEVELEFGRICGGQNAMGRCLPFAALLVEKKCNSAGLQLADLVARPIGRKILDPAQPNRAFDILAAKLRRSPAGEVRGWGLKVFP
jgi:hypothetical protein